MAPSHRRHARTTLIATVAAAALIVSACGSSSDSSSSSPSQSGQSPSPSLPKGWTYAAGSDVPTVPAATPALPAKVTDGTKTAVTVRDISKIIVAGDDVSEILAGLGLADKVYAAPDSSTGPTGQKAPVKFTFERGGGAEGLLAVKGTLFIGNNTTRHGQVAAKFRAAGTDAVVMDDQQDTPAKIRAIASYVGVAASGDELASKVSDQLTKAKETASKVGNVKILQVTATGAGAANAVVGTGTAGADIISSIGSTSVGVEAKLRGYSRRYSNEALLAASPEVIVMTAEDVKKWNGESGFNKAFPTLAQTPAGKAQRIIVLPDDQIKYAGPATGAGAEALAQALVDTDPKE